MSRVQTHRFWCQLKLIRHGLIEEAKMVEDVGIRRVQRKETPGGSAFGQGLAEGEAVFAKELEDLSDDAEDDVMNLMNKREAFVKQGIKRARRRGDDVVNVHQDEAVLAARKQVIADFKQDILKVAACRHCKA